MELGKRSEQGKERLGDEITVMKDNDEVNEWIYLAEENKKNWASSISFSSSPRPSISHHIYPLSVVVQLMNFETRQTRFQVDFLFFFF